MEKNKRKDIINYAIGSLYMPIVNRRHIEAMVILHFAIPEKDAQVLVGEALVKALEVYQRREKTQVGELRQTRNMIDRLREWTPEFESVLLEANK